MVYICFIVYVYGMLNFKLRSCTVPPPYTCGLHICCLPCAASCDLEVSRVDLTGIGLVSSYLGPRELLDLSVSRGYGLVAHNLHQSSYYIDKPFIIIIIIMPL